MEENEWNFCSMWAAERIRINDCADVLVNPGLQGDYFFNRARVAGCQNLGATIEQVAEAFWRSGLDCYLHDVDGTLPKRMKQIDAMHVLKADGRKEASSKVKVIDRQLLPVWIGVFCKSFGVPGWKAEVERIFNANFPEMELLLSYRDGAPVGCAALFGKGGVTGLYCLGTVSGQRRRGLAIEMLKAASAMKKNLFLQALDSEGFADLYRKAGFRLAYTKKIIVIPKPGEQGN